MASQMLSMHEKYHDTESCYSTIRELEKTQE